MQQGSLGGLEFLAGSESISYRERGVVSWMPGVIIREDEPFEKALKRFKKACEKAGIMSDVKKHQHFEKPSERRKRKINAAKRRLRKEQIRD